MPTVMARPLPVPFRNGQRKRRPRPPTAPARPLQQSAVGENRQPTPVLPRKGPRGRTHPDGARSRNSRSSLSGAAMQRRSHRSSASATNRSALASGRSTRSWPRSCRRTPPNTRSSQCIGDSTWTWTRTRTMMGSPTYLQPPVRLHRAPRLRLTTMDAATLGLFL